MKRLRILAATLSFLVLSVMIVGCAEPKTIFPDGNLEVAIRDTLGKPAGAEIMPPELASPTLFWANNRDIFVLGGLEYCTNLTELYLNGNQIRDVSPLSSLTNLTLLYLDGNKIDDISALSFLTNLTRLRLSSNQISDISALSSLTNLTRLRLSRNQISDISPLVANSGLSTGDNIWLEDNNLDLTEGSEDMVNIKALEDRGVVVNY